MWWRVPYERRSIPMRTLQTRGVFYCNSFCYALNTQHSTRERAIIVDLLLPVPVPRNAHGAVGQHRIVVGHVQMGAGQPNRSGGGQQTLQAPDHAARIDRVVLGERAQLQLGHAALVQRLLDRLVPVRIRDHVTEMCPSDCAPVVFYSRAVLVHVGACLVQVRGQKVDQRAAGARRRRNELAGRAEHQRTRLAVRYEKHTCSSSSCTSIGRCPRGTHVRLNHQLELGQTGRPIGRIAAAVGQIVEHRGGDASQLICIAGDQRLRHEFAARDRDVPQHVRQGGLVRRDAAQGGVLDGDVPDELRRGGVQMKIVLVMPCVCDCATN